LDEDKQWLLAVVHVVVPHSQAPPAGVFLVLPFVLAQSGTSEQFPSAPHIFSASHFSTKVLFVSLHMQAAAL
jgi:hypothetical protein